MGKRNIATMIQRALNLVDERLIDHGVRVSYLVKAILEEEAQVLEYEKNQICLMAMLHDIGAYRMQEIDRLLSFEAQRIWEHSIYGYLFLRELSPIGELSEAVLYHHMDFDRLPGKNPVMEHYSQIVQVADRIDAFLMNAEEDWERGLRSYLEEHAGKRFDPAVIAAFWAAQEKYDLVERMQQEMGISDILTDDREVQTDYERYVELLAHAIDFRSHYTVVHTETTVQICLYLAKRMGLADTETEQIYHGAMLHDMGKIGIPIEILEKPGRLTDDEMEIMRTHVVLTGDIIRGCTEEAIARIAVRHHEKLDGSGYPLGLRAEEMTLPERIVQVGDIVSALTNTRSYKDAFPKEKTMTIIRELGRNKKVDPEVVQAISDGFEEMEQAVRIRCRPIWEAYERIQRDYGILFQQYSAMGSE